MDKGKVVAKNSPLIPVDSIAHQVETADRYPEDASSNPARVNIYQLTSAASDYREKFLFMYL